MSNDNDGRDQQDEPGGSDPERSAPDDASRSDRRSKANRRNAQRSTGPRSEEGKAKSARNAVKHGVFVVRLEPISKGAFAEDPDEFADEAIALVEALSPRDAIELASATRIAGLLINLERLERFGMALIEGASRMTAEDFTAGVRTGPRRTVEANAAFLLAQFLDGVLPEERAMFSVFATVIRSFGPNPRARVKDVWDAEHEPATDDEWKGAFLTLKRHFWPNEAEARKWAHELALRLSRDLESVDGLEEQIAANRILGGPFDLMLKYHARLRREYQALRSDYADLQSRPLEPSGKNEPNPPEDDS